MKQKGLGWYLVLGLFFIGLIILPLSFQYRYERAIALAGDVESRDYEGNDWITWRQTDAGVEVAGLHPLAENQGYLGVPIRKGDILLWIDFDKNRVYSPEVVDNISRAAPPGQPFVLSMERINPVSKVSESHRLILRNGFRLPFSFNDYGIFWTLHIWISGLGAFISLVILAIITPIFRSNWKSYRALFGIVWVVFLFYFIQLIHQLYLIIETDPRGVFVQKVFLLGYAGTLLLYGLFYLIYKVRSRNWPFLIPSFLLISYFLWRLTDILFFSRTLGLVHDLVENYSYLIFLWHLLAALGLYSVSNWHIVRRQGFFGLFLVIVPAMAGMLYFFVPLDPAWREPVTFGFQLLLFFPLVNATFLQLQFGRVSVVLTRSLQYIIFLLVSLLLFLVISQFYDYLLPSNPYKRLMEFISFLLVVLVLRLTFLSNEGKLSRYFVTSQQQRISAFKTFIASIPRYTSAEELKRDLLLEIRDFFNAAVVEIWVDNGPQIDHSFEGEEQLHRIFDLLSEEHTIWSRSKEIANYRLPAELERGLVKSHFALVLSLTVDDGSKALLMLGRKRRGVYNLSDLELISQLVQQTQLTLNVLTLYDREKDLLQQTYEANLTALRSQINPHFLFNTLNSIGELVHESAELAEEAVEKLSYIFRYTLNMSSKNFVPLSQEISLISTYLDLEKIRFASRLTIEIDVADDISEVQVPSFILMTLTENTIKHGIAKILSNGEVSVKAFSEGPFLVCEVRDNGPGIDTDRIFKSTGLSNSIARLENIYHQRDLLEFENTGHGTLVTMRIPLNHQ